MSIYRRLGAVDPRTGKRAVTWIVQIGSRGHRLRVAVGPRKAEAEAVEAKMKEDMRQGRFPELRRVKPILI